MAIIRTTTYPIVFETSIGFLVFFFWCTQSSSSKIIFVCYVRYEPLRFLRNANFFFLDCHLTNYGLFEPVTNMSRTFNLFSRVTRYQFRSIVRSAILTNMLEEERFFALHWYICLHWLFGLDPATEQEQQQNKTTTV